MILAVVDPSLIGRASGSAMAGAHHGEAQEQPTPKTPRPARAVVQPKTPEAQRLYVLGLERQRQGRLTSATTLLNKAAKLAPDSPRVHHALAATWSARGHDQKALDAARRAYDLAAALVQECGLSGLLGLRHSNGMEIIREHGPEHMHTGAPIVYTPRFTPE